MSYEYLPPGMHSRIAEFLLGTREYMQNKNATNKIIKWWNKNKKLDEEDWCYNTSVRKIMLETNDQQLFDYPTFAINKLRLYSSDVLEEPPQFTKRSQVLEWILNNLDKHSIAIVGI